MGHDEQIPSAQTGSDDADTVDASDASQALTRRSVMRAAAVGTVATGVYIGLSSVPHYAAAATEGGPPLDYVLIDETGDLGSVESVAGTEPGCLVACCIQCWNSGDISTMCAAETCICGTHKTCGNGSAKDTGTLQVDNDPSGYITLAWELWGPTDTAGCTGEAPGLTLAISGITSAQKCQVTVAVSCNTGTPVGGGTQSNLGNGAVFIAAPRCTGSMVGGPPDEAKCPDTASVKITLACTA